MKTFILGQNIDQVLEMIPDKSIRVVRLGTTQVCVSRVAKDFFAFESNCPHQRAALNQGWVTVYGEVVCPLHEYRFDMKSGEIRAGSCGDLKTYKTKLTEEGLKIFI
ncbi:ferredoxin subunit of nitrite reductase and ring-hydroxylating dioxygenase [Belliella baltica DSM 15883]|uniref:Ferredoxin subunit of nitrite reductase and ring-hydroxylating dioxygenase n=1 Tax=Belliella baltica (strain DSM 15883 / CIP 108006 / LMG 21964 / BA134) TaxID=866536 RepID=I3Z2N8_BELBD|nr:Rieske 2Fe-2S domain-containing protein [Belliella baltica]AFL83506.1 ferredoxin subunit of nitrite reductase and ring-hydroxylating dioxygenase [Belliella baltica DSM 15883]